MVTYLLRSNGVLRAACCRAFASACGVSAPSTGADGPFLESAAAGAAFASPFVPALGLPVSASPKRSPASACLTGDEVEPAISRASGSMCAASASAYSATRRVSVVNSIALQERDQLARVGLANNQIVERRIELHLVVELHELARDARLLRMLDQRLAALRLLDLAGALEQRFEIAIVGDELRRRLDADARYARHVIDAVARERLHLDDLLRRHAEFLDHFGDADAAVLHGVVHHHLVGDELHQILVGRDDGDGCAALARLRAHRSRSGRRPRSRLARCRADQTRARLRGSAEIAG